ncbi:MAG: hypothetical protein EXR55_06250 [Dehalococcoidia bacterium]|nr:hypothetical protein [Dehalococcoidia bacterium]
MRLSGERWEHIVVRHSELGGQQEEVLDVVSTPDLVQEGDSGTLLAVKRQKGTHLVVVYREASPDDGFVITSYLTRALRPRRTLWRR